MSTKVEFDLEILIEEYTNYIYKIINSIATNSLCFQDKEEIVADTFYLLWKNQDKITTNLKAYLSRIAKNCTYEKLRKNNNLLKIDEEQIKYDSKDIDNLITIKEKIKKLDLEEQLIFEYYYYFGLKINEISKKLGKSTSTIKIKLYRLRKKLKEELI